MTAKLIRSVTAKLPALVTAKLPTNLGWARDARWHLMTAKLPTLVTAKVIALENRHSSSQTGEEEPEMSGKRVEIHVLQDLVRLHRMGVGKRAVARMLGMSPNTERPYREAFEAAGLLEGAADALPSLEELRQAVLTFAPPKTPAQQVSTAEKWGAQIEDLFLKGKQAKAIFDHLKLTEGDFDVSSSAVRRYVRRLSRERGVRAEDVVVPVVTAAGEVAQVDFGYVGSLYDPAQETFRKAWVFLMVLGHSRHQFARVVFDQKVETWLELHAAAFEWFGGVPKTVVPDNLKAAVIRAAFSVDEQTALNRSYREFARHFGFKVDPAPPYSPEKKGKVESGVKYVKNNFFKGRQEESIEAVNAELARWVKEIAGQRRHGTTGRKPLCVFEEDERSALLSLPAKKYTPVVWKRAKVHADCHVVFGRRLYSAPWKFVGQEVWLRATRRTLTVYSIEGERLADHHREGDGPHSTNAHHLPELRGHYRHRSREHWEREAARVGPETAAFVRETFDADDVLSQLRTVIAVVSHLKKFPTKRAEAACRRARLYGSYSYQAIKNILEKALDMEALPVTLSEPNWDTPPTYARDISTLVIRGNNERH